MTRCTAPFELSHHRIFVKMLADQAMHLRGRNAAEVVLFKEAPDHRQVIEGLYYLFKDYSPTVQVTLSGYAGIEEQESSFFDAEVR